MEHRFLNKLSRPPYDWPLKWQYALALSLVAMSLLVRWLLGGELGGRVSFLLLFCVLLPLALLVRPAPFVVSSLLGLLGVWLIFLSPRMENFIAADVEEQLVALFALALAATGLTAWLSRRTIEQREKDQRELLESARRQKLINDAAPALISYLDTEMRYRVANKAYGSWFGVDPRTIAGMHMRELMGEEAFNRVRPHAEAALNGVHAEFETEIPYLKAGTRFVRASYVPDVRPDGVISGFFALVVDITDRKRMEDELRLRSKQFETVLNAAPLGVYLVDAELRIQHVNPVAEEVAGMPALQAVGHRIDKIMPVLWGADRGAEILRIFRHTLQTGEPYHQAEFVAQRQDRDSTEYYDWRLERIVLPDGRFGVVCYFRELSEQVRARHAIAESELRYRTLFESIDEGFCILQVIFDEEERPVDYRYLEVNPAFEKQSGMPDALGKTIRELVPDIEPFWFDIYGEVALTGTPKRFVDYSKSMGRWFDIYTFRIGNPEKRRVAVLFVDVTDRKQTEEAIRESERRFRTMADNAPVLIWVSDTSGGCTYFNRQWLKFTGRPLEAELGDGWMEGVHPDDREDCDAAFRLARAPRKPFRVEYRLRRHDGEYRWLVDEGVPRFLENGTFTGYIGSCIDITERKKYEQGLRESDRRKDEFLATLAHELRNPLAGISTATTILADVPGDRDRVTEMTAIIERQSSQLVRLINDLLDVSRISRGKVKLERNRVDVARVVREVVEDALPVCGGKGLQLQAEFPDQPIMVDADAVRLSQVVNNLLENACKFTPGGGDIKIVVERDAGDAVVRVADTGVGMAQEQLSRIFEMFAQGEELPAQRAGGLGIGLSLAKSIVELHGGKIEARSSGPGTGSEFVVRLRAVESETPHTRAEAGAGASGHRRVRPRRIVAADDNRDSLHAVALILRMKGHEVQTAIDGPQALELVRASRPDVALLDIGMPTMDGYEVARRIRREPWGKDVLLVAMTGWGQERDKQDAREAGFDTHLTKPVDLAVLDRLFEERVLEKQAG